MAVPATCPRRTRAVRRPSEMRKVGVSCWERRLPAGLGAARMAALPAKRHAPRWTRKRLSFRRATLSGHLDDTAVPHQPRCDGYGGTDVFGLEGRILPQDLLAALACAQELEDGLRGDSLAADRRPHVADFPSLRSPCGMRLSSSRRRSLCRRPRRDASRMGGSESPPLARLSPPCE